MKEIDVEKELLKEIKNKKFPKEIEKEFEKRREHVCKPCWELKYCPYGPLVEQFPLPRILRKEAIEHNEFLKKQLEKKAYTGWRKKVFEQEVKEFDPKQYPEKLTREEIENSCREFGHICPVFFVNEPFTETNEERRITRHIPRPILIRVVRRDNSTCQICGRVLLDKEIEIDHIIPFSKGGPTEEHNLRVICPDCNKSKSDNTSEIFSNFFNFTPYIF